jgi:hypothetical protein
MFSAIAKLRAVKVVHTAAWAFFASAILLIPIAAWRDAWRATVVMMSMVTVECLVLVVNGMRCPLTQVAARYTDDRVENFDIYLPRWLARYNKQIFGPLFVLGVIVSAVLRWR